MLTPVNHQLPILPMGSPQPVVGMRKQPVAIMPKTADYAIEMSEMTSLNQQKKTILDRYICQRLYAVNYKDRELIKMQNLERKALQFAAEKERLIESIKTIKEPHLKQSDFPKEMPEFQANPSQIYREAILIDGNTFLGAPSPLEWAETADYALSNRQKLTRIVDCL